MSILGNYLKNYKNEETLIPAMVVGFKSSKAMDVEDELSENQDGMNLVLLGEVSENTRLLVNR